MTTPFDALMPITPRPDIVFTSGAGSWLTDSTGKRYLDFIQGWAVNALGHCHPAITKALREQSARLLNPSPAFYNQPMVELASLLVENSAFDHVFFANSGAEANEGAIKLARKWGALNRCGAFEIITFNNSFHGRSLATMAASGKPGWENLFAPKTPGFVHLPYNRLEAVSRAVTPATVAVMLEPIQGEAGVIPATREFIAGLRKLTRDKGILLILDEVQTGMGRTGTLFAHEQFEITPDIMTLGKGIGGGVALSALLAKREVSCFDPGDQGGTYNGNPLACAAGLAVLNTLLEEGFLARVQARGLCLVERLQTLTREFHLGEVRGSGLLLALDTGDMSAADIASRARERGLLLNAPRPNTLRLMPALTVSDGEIALMADILGTVLADIRRP